MSVGPFAERVAAAKLWLISRPPAQADDAPLDLAYLATALYSLITIPSPRVAMVRADRYWRIYLNPEWVAATDVPEIGRELAHVTWHLLMDHAGRASGVGVDATTAAHWHAACDLTVTDILDWDGAVPGSARTHAETARQAKPAVGRGRSAEDYYAILSGLPAATDRERSGTLDNDTDCGSACDGIPRSSDLPPDADVGYVPGVEADAVRKRVAIDYLDAVKGRGDNPGEAARWARQITEPTIPWEPLLAKAVRRAIGWTTGRHEPTWTRPSRRQSAHPDVLQPGWRRPVPAVAMVIDTSASIDDELLGKAMGEVDGALRGIGIPGASVTVLACDAAVGAVNRVRKATDATLIGGGGTDMRVGIAAASALRPRPDLIVVFTDGYTPWPAPPPGSVVIAAMLGRPGEPLPAPPAWTTRIDCTLNP